MLKTDGVKRLRMLNRLGIAGGLIVVNVKAIHVIIAYLVGLVSWLSFLMTWMFLKYMGML